MKLNNIQSTTPVPSSITTVDSIGACPIKDCEKEPSHTNSSTLW
jgi:hypothetical protein